MLGNSYRAMSPFILWKKLDKSVFILESCGIEPSSAYIYAIAVVMSQAVRWHSCVYAIAVVMNSKTASLAVEIGSPSIYKSVTSIALSAGKAALQLKEGYETSLVVHTGPFWLSVLQLQWLV